MSRWKSSNHGWIGPRTALGLAACVVMACMAGGCAEEPAKMVLVQSEAQFQSDVLQSQRPVLVEFFKGG